MGHLVSRATRGARAGPSRRRRFATAMLSATVPRRSVPHRALIYIKMYVQWRFYCAFSTLNEDNPFSALRVAA